jgi:predicted RNA-binding protein with PIN domain
LEALGDRVEDLEKMDASDSQPESKVEQDEQKVSPEMAEYLKQCRSEKEELVYDSVLERLVSPEMDEHLKKIGYEKDELAYDSEIERLLAKYARVKPGSGTGAGSTSKGSEGK